jgi:hypothetical protein
MLVVELLLLGAGTQAFHVHVAFLADPENVAIEGVLLCSEQSSQLVNGRLIVQVHDWIPLFAH